ncbi:hypothetical protein JR316_0006550 [Psilocybe cubensis]|nr:hypothetical protein JR316_0006550 [Psilocybe cubensis]KAH9482020.1 hypothetical protein JR316_0006550 [Psilocybe cubensis]
MKLSLLLAVTSSIYAASAAALFTPAVTVKLVIDDLVKFSTQFTKITADVNNFPQTGAQGASANEVAFHANTMVNNNDAAREGLVLAHDYAPGPGPCHPFPGAVAEDCLSLISENLNNDTVVPCINGLATLTQGECSIVTTCNSAIAGKANAPKNGIMRYLAVRRALTTIGSCALSDYGSISGYYVADKGVKTCYLYPGR